MASPSLLEHTPSLRGLSRLIHELDAHSGVLDEATIRDLLSQSDVNAIQVAPFVEPRQGGYARRTVMRRQNYELLVLTWTPGQRSAAHDHCGSLCGLKVVAGRLTEQLFQQGPDGQVRKTTATHLDVGQITVDPGVVIHSLANAADSTEVLVTVHIYSPPLPEMRRYAITDGPPEAIFSRVPAPGSRIIAVVGGGFTGTMVLANLLRFAGADEGDPLHIILIDRQPAFGEGAAYRTSDDRHLLNVPVSRMSAWPDRPDHFLRFVQSKDPTVGPGDFVPRKLYGAYVRHTLFEQASSAGANLSVEILRDEVTTLAREEGACWIVQTATGRTIRADVAALTLGHRPPDDVVARQWTGPRDRFVLNPWTSLILSQISSDEPVLLLGAGLTSVDAILTLNRTHRTAPIIAVSRRGLLPLPHSRLRLPPANIDALLTAWLDPSTTLTIRCLASMLRHFIRAAAQDGVDWRQVIDALRPAIPRLWARLSVGERERFLKRLRPFWEPHRHRMAPDVVDTINQLRTEGLLEVGASTLIAASADSAGVEVTLAGAGGGTSRKLRVSWVVNCTGPGVQNRPATHSILHQLLEEGILCEDELNLGIRTDAIGRAIDKDGRTVPSLFIAGTLRKSSLWESTAVPELREQSQAIANSAAALIRASTNLNGI